MGVGIGVGAGVGVGAGAGVGVEFAELKLSKYYFKNLSTSLSLADSLAFNYRDVLCNSSKSLMLLMTVSYSYRASVLT